MTKEQLAEKLNGREYSCEITKEECAEAKAAGLVVIFGYSDDNVEFRGAVFDEVGIYGSGTLNVSRNGALPAHKDCDCEFCGYHEKAAKCATIEVEFDTADSAWEFTTSIPHAVFSIVEAGEPYSKGIVLSIEDLPAL